MSIRCIWALPIGLMLSGCIVKEAPPAAPTTGYVLYRSSPVESIPRIKIADFDADDTAEFNHVNCENAAKGFMADPDEKPRYWCVAKNWP